MANAGLPGTSGFVGEFLVIVASFKANFWYAFVAALTLILGAAYTLWLVKRVIWGDVGNDGVASLKDLNAREFIVLAVLAVAVLVARRVAGAAPRRDAADARVAGGPADGQQALRRARWKEPDMVLTIADVMPAAAEVFVAAAACLLLLVDACLGARGRGTPPSCSRSRRSRAPPGSRLRGCGAEPRRGPERPLRRRPHGHGAEALRLRRGRGDAPVFARLPRATRAPEGRVPRARAFRRARHPGHRVGRAAC